MSLEISSSFQSGFEGLPDESSTQLLAILLFQSTLFYTFFFCNISNPSISCEPQDLKFIISLEKELKRGATTVDTLISVHSELYHQRQLPHISEYLELPCS